MNELVEAPAPALWRNGRFEEDGWTVVAEGMAVPEGPAILPLVRLMAEAEMLACRNSPLGVAVEPNEAMSELATILDRVALVSLPFHKFSDGRSMSFARLLRERHGFRGEVRATGDVLIDQMPLMARCGFDAYLVRSPITTKQLASGMWPDVPFYLQPVSRRLRRKFPRGRAHGRAGGPERTWQ